MKYEEYSCGRRERAICHIWVSYMKVLDEVRLRSDARNPQMNSADARDMMKYTVVRRIWGRSLL